MHKLRPLGLSCFAMSNLRDQFHTCLLHAAAALGRALTRMADEHFGRVGLSPTMAFILLSTKEAQGISLTELAIIHRLDRSTISRAVDKLAADQFVERSGEGRDVRVFLTPKGTRKAADAMAAWKKVQLDYTLLLSQGESQFLAERVARADNVLRENGLGAMERS